MKQQTGIMQFKQQALNQVLQEICQEGQFITAILASSEGFVVARAAPTPSGEAETIAAMVAYLSDAAQRTRTRLGLAPLDEVAFRDQVGQLVVCRRCVIDEQDELILMIMTPVRQTYRRLTTVALQRISDIWHNPP